MSFTIIHIDDFIAAEVEAQKVAFSRIPAWAFYIKVGDFFVRTIRDVAVWSEVLPMTVEDEESGDLVEVPYPKKHAYRFTKSYSVGCPRGELGDVHLSVIDRVVTKKEFEAARARNWV